MVLWQSTSASREAVQELTRPAALGLAGTASLDTAVVATSKRILVVAESSHDPCNRLPSADTCTFEAGNIPDVVAWRLEDRRR